MVERGRLGNISWNPVFFDFKQEAALQIMVSRKSSAGCCVRVSMTEKFIFICCVCVSPFSRWASTTRRQCVKMLNLYYLVRRKVPRKWCTDGIKMASTSTQQRRQGAYETHIWFLYPLENFYGFSSCVAIGLRHAAVPSTTKWRRRARFVDWLLAD